MNRRLWPLLSLLIGGPLWLMVQMPAAAVDTTTPADATPKTGEIQQLIAQLGDRRYLQRQLAETQLLQRGAEAFGELQAALQLSDLEIVSRAKYLLNQIRIEWARPTDPAAVRSIMARYDELPLKSRLAKVAQLARLDNEQGFGALCRIARYDASKKLVRYAALSILENGFLPGQRTAAAVAMLNEEIGQSDQVPLPWIGVYSDQLLAPKKIDSRWLALIDAEIALLAEETGETDESLVVSLLRSHLELCAELSDAQAILANWQRRIGLSEDRNRTMNSGLAGALTWMISRGQWKALELIENDYAEAIQEKRLLLYLVALARDKQGRGEAAEQLAQRALLLEADEAITHIYIADLISELGRHDWAEREWRSLVDLLPATDVLSLKARESLALYRLHDQGDHQAAADLLGESLDAINKDPVVKAQYQRSGDRRVLHTATSNREFFLACHFEAQEEYELQRKHLDRAYQLSPGNADVLIAMYRSPEASEIYRKATVKKIQSLQRAMEKEIKQSPEEAYKYNQWAWLVSNTEGDFHKAVKRSQHSLKLQPESPSYMDTLGRCYYAVGDLDSAVKVQRKAVTLHPHMMVMQRQLKLFEDELQTLSSGGAAE